MILTFADSRALVRAYLADEPDHEALRARLLDDEETVYLSAIAAVEVPRALTIAGGLERSAATAIDACIADFDRRTGAEGPAVLLAPGDAVLARARELACGHGLRTLDAIHLASADVALRRLAEEGDELLFVTRDDDQASAARALGLTVA